MAIVMDSAFETAGMSLPAALGRVGSSCFQSATLRQTAPPDSSTSLGISLALPYIPFKPACYVHTDMPSSD